jgi:N-acylneuraminate cytidylyltransferase/CMP-N,N'-diacetyllegionaminic acid synthase
MINNKKIIAVIPARKGSKGLKGKNIKELCGKPLIAWSIEAALSSKYLDEVVVSTDDKATIDIANKYGASAPFLRPEYLSSDVATTFDVLKHTINFYKNELNKEFDYIVLLEPTSPLRDFSDIDNAVERLIYSDASSIVGISKTEDQNPVFLVNKDKDDFISGYVSKDMPSLRRQDVKDIYFFDGSIYISELKSLLDRETFYHNNTIGFEMPKYKSLEVDDIYDFIMVEAIMKYKKYK